MSNRALSWVFEHSPLKGEALVVHLAIADVVNDLNDNEFWVSMAKLAAKAHVTRGTAGRVMVRLEALGLVETLSVATGRGRHNRYRLLMPSESGEQTRTLDTGKCASDDLESARLTTESARLTTTAPLIEPKEPKEPTQGGGDALLGFSDFWEAYPRRDGKRIGRAKCEALWSKLSLEDRRAAWRGAKNYAASGWRPKDPERWLRDRLWTEWQEPARTDPAPGPRRAIRDGVDQDRDPSHSGRLVAP